MQKEQPKRKRLTVVVVVVTETGVEGRSGGGRGGLRGVSISSFWWEREWEGARVKKPRLTTLEKYLGF